MLVLTRRENSSIKIGQDITVTVLSVQGHRVRLGISAPKDVRVLRDELCGDEFDKTWPADAGESTSASWRTVLVIEDDPIHARLIRKSLCSIPGTNVTVVETAKLALDALGALAGGSDHRKVVLPDLIMLDMGLPDSTGLEVLRAIRRDDRLRTTPVVMLSCCDDESLIEECVVTGANAFVVKSPRWDDFRVSVSRIGDFWTKDCFVPRRSDDRTQAARLLPNTASTI